MLVTTGLPKHVPEAIAQYSALDNYDFTDSGLGFTQKKEEETARAPKILWFEKFGYFKLNDVTIMDWNSDDQRIIEGFSNPSFVKKLFKRKELRHIESISLNMFRCSDEVFNQIMIVICDHIPNGNSALK